VFNGNAEDSSRNQLHATVSGPGGVFVEDGPRKVLLLTGDGSYAQLPASALSGEDAVAVVGWLYLPTRASGPVFDFGQGSATRLFAFVDAQEFRAAAVVDGQARGETEAKPVVENQWVHFAVVLETASRVLTTYIDDMRAGQATNVDVTLAQLLPQASPANRLFLGRAQDDRAPTLHGRLRDLRLYRIVLGDEPVATIRRNALAAALPARDRAAPPEIDTAEVRKPGTYTVAGRVPGTRFEPKATVLVKVRVGTFTPPDRLVETSPLSQVVLDRDSQGRDTPFIRNRDKFIRGLASSNPDSFLYNFRETFGEPQPEGTVPLEGWDNQTTRLRGHASGHYLSAIAQAYASTGYDAAPAARYSRCAASTTSGRLRFSSSWLPLTSRPQPFSRSPR
jgi:hypothetical protein